MDGMLPYISAVAAVGTIGFGAAWALRRLSRASEADSVGVSAAEDLPQFTARMYAPVERLFDPADLLFLRQQPGYSRAAESGFRRKRARVFRMYLQSMERDYRALHRAARSIAAQGAGHPELSARLLEMQFSFQKTVWTARLQALCFERGWPQPELSLQPLVSAMVSVGQAMRPNSTAPTV